jgi:hypothetical protein
MDTSRAASFVEEHVAYRGWSQVLNRVKSRSARIYVSAAQARL